MSASLEIQLIAVVVAVACALPGVFLVLQRMAMMSDAISHAILPGIVVAFFLTGNLGSPWLIVGAAATGVLTVALVEMLRKTGLLKEDAAIGIVFPALFSLGVVLIARYAGDIHLDVDAVLLGELAFAPFNRMIVGGVDIGPQALVVMSVILALNVVLLSLFHKELVLTTFDPALASALGFLPGAVTYGLMGVVSVTAVGAFDAVGSILVVALMVAPPAAAYLWTERLRMMMLFSVFFGISSGVGGYWMARWLDASIAGSMASVAGIVFCISFLLAPDQGWLPQIVRKSAQKVAFGRTMLLIHLLHHEGLVNASRECSVPHLEDHLRWEHGFATRAVRSALQMGYVSLQDEVLFLTDEGRKHANRALVDL
jgi:manganese/zinc/iron transport system permease protein